MKLSKSLTFFYSLRLSIRTFLILSMILIIGYTDYITPPEFSTRLLYLIPLFLTVWDGRGITPGLFYSIICTIVYFYTELLQNNIHWHGLYLLWEYIINCCYFIAFVVVVDMLKKSNYQLLLKNEELKKNNEELEKSNDQKDKFFSIIAHDLRSPFQGFLSLTKVMAEEVEGYTVQELSESGKVMHQTANNLFNLLKNLLEWAQIQKGSMSFQPEFISVTDLIAENVQILKKRGEQKGITIINKVSGNLQVYADERMINSVLLNLLSNAVKFTKREGIVTICAEKTDNQMIEISVNDTGIGMSINLVKKLFKVGEKVRTLGTEGELSTGLGLLLCKEFVEKQGGSIWVESEEGKGTTIKFRLKENKVDQLK